MVDVPVSEPRFLCKSGDLRERQGSVLFDVLEWRQPATAFAVRFDDHPVAYLNQCAHVPTALDWQPGEFWDQEHRYIICAVHGALYEPSRGVCVLGPCPGKSLTRIPLEERDGNVYWYPSERIQPAI